MDTPQEEMTVRQLQALRRLALTPVAASVPRIPPEALKPIPWWFRAEQAAPLLWAALIFCPLLLAFVHLPQNWSGPIAVKSGTIIELATQGTHPVYLPAGKGTFLLEGPGSVEFRRIRRHLLTGRDEGTIVLREGTLWFDGRSHSPKQIDLQTPLLSLRITGTQFLLEHRPLEGTRLRVLEGSVEVMELGGWIRIAAGEKIWIDPAGNRRPFLDPVPEPAPPGDAPAPPSDWDGQGPTLWYEQ